MKKQTLITLIIAITATMTVNAQTIALHSATGVQMIKGTTALATAYAAAQSGDTLYLSGHTFTPPSAFDKQLTIIGAGHYVDSTLATGKTFINGNITLNENADNFYIEGVDINGDINFANGHSVNGVVVKRCKFNKADVQGNLENPSSNLSFIGNVVVNRLILTNGTNVLVSNNIINQGLHNTNGSLISNNIFLATLSDGSYENFRGNNNTVSNNIFLKKGSYGIVSGSNQGNMFYNNLFAFTPSAQYDFGTNPTLVGNYTGISQADIFVSQTGNTFDYAHDYHLQAPATYLGTDDTQVGIYGGTFPYKEGAVPLNPHIQINNTATTTDANGNLQIQIQVEAQSN